uniref:Uncharacterized protein n=1 Tax=Knipowitschia caucasica TaxID=637954 RepID=A0AAV2KWF1_KNICA
MVFGRHSVRVDRLAALKPDGCSPEVPPCLPPAAQLARSKRPAVSAASSDPQRKHGVPAGLSARMDHLACERAHMKALLQDVRRFSGEHVLGTPVPDLAPLCEDDVMR